MGAPPAVPMPVACNLRSQTLNFMSAPLIVDPETIANLRALSPDDDDAFLKEIIGIFLEDTPKRITELKQSHAAGLSADFTRAAHSIKGSSSNVGAMELRAIAEHLEHHARKEGIAGLESKVAEIEGAFIRAKAELEKLLA